LSISAISKRYAKALVAIGTEKKSVDKFGQELAAIRSAFGVEKSLRLILESPNFSQEKKAAILNDLMKKLKLSAGMKRFLGLLLEKNRLQYLAQIDDDFRALADTLSGTLRAKVMTAAEVEEGQQTAIKDGLEKQTGKTVELQTEINAELIGGLKVEIGGRLFDGSIQTQLKRLEDTLKKG